VNGTAAGYTKAAEGGLNRASFALFTIQKEPASWHFICHSYGLFSANHIFCKCLWGQDDPQVILARFFIHPNYYAEKLIMPRNDA